MTPVAVRELAEKQVAALRLRWGVQFPSTTLAEGRLAELIAEAVAPLVEAANTARRDLAGCWQADMYAGDAEALDSELARWRSE